MARKKKYLQDKGSLFHQLRTILCHVLFYTNEDCQEPIDQPFLPALPDQIYREAQGILNCSLPAQHTFSDASATLNVVLQEKLKFLLNNSSLTESSAMEKQQKTHGEQKKKQLWGKMS